MNMGEFNVDDFPLPDWAERKSDGNYMEVGAQLCTRDGRRIGNAKVVEIDNFGWALDHVNPGPLATVVSDMGNRVEFNEAALESYFYPPEYIMKVEEGIKKVTLAELDLVSEICGDDLPKFIAGDLVGGGGHISWSVYDVEPIWSDYFSVWVDPRQCMGEEEEYYFGPMHDTWPSRLMEFKPRDSLFEIVESV